MKRQREAHGVDGTGVVVRDGKAGQAVLVALGE